MRTVICHFYNEEYLLPWWLAHHSTMFDHGIMIDYNSTDASCDLIRHFCPRWEIHRTRNDYFDSALIDREVEDYERGCEGWRMALNVTEFLYGNFEQLDAVSEPTQHFIGNYVFVDNGSCEEPVYEKPLHEQITFGYLETDERACWKLHFGLRASRALHNFARPYPPQGGRHYRYVPTLTDLAIFYYGYAFPNDKLVKRKMQIKDRISPEEKGALGVHHPNTLTRDRFLSNIANYHLPRCRDLSEEIGRFAQFHHYYHCDLPFAGAA